MDERREFINSQISNEFTVQSNLSRSNGFARTNEPGVTGLEGTFDPVVTSEVRINGLLVPINQRDGTWDGDQPESEVIFSLGSSGSILIMEPIKVLNGGIKNSMILNGWKVHQNLVTVTVEK